MQMPETLFMGALLCCLYACRFLGEPNVSSNMLLIVNFFVLAFLPGIVGMNHGVSTLFYFFSTLAVFFAAKSFCCNTVEYVLGCLRIVYAIAVCCIFLALYAYWDIPEPLGQVFPGSSTNGIPSYLIVLQAMLSITTFFALRRLPLISAGFTVVVAFFGLGRGSLIVSVLILLASAAINFFFGRVSKLQRICIFVAFLVCVIAIAFYVDILKSALVDTTKLQEGLVDPYRMEIFRQYIAKIDALSFITGASYSGTVVESQYDGNPHISFIRVHSLLGIFGLLFVFFSPLFIMVAKKKLLDKFVTLLFISLMLLRALSEPILFPSLLDFFYFSMFFLFYGYAQGEKSIHSRIGLEKRFA